MLDAARRLLGERRYAYQKTFNGPLAEVVLRDLALFCRAHESTFETDPRDAAKLDGRRDVWLRIQEHLRLTPEQLWEIYTRRPAQED